MHIKSVGSDSPMTNRHVNDVAIAFQYRQKDGIREFQQARLQKLHDFGLRQSVRAISFKDFKTEDTSILSKSVAPHSMTSCDEKAKLLKFVLRDFATRWLRFSRRVETTCTCAILHVDSA